VQVRVQVLVRAVLHMIRSHSLSLHDLIFLDGNAAAIQTQQRHANTHACACSVTQAPMHVRAVSHRHTRTHVQLTIHTNTHTRAGWWYKPEYIINDLNINSAIAKPWHDEVVMLRDGSQPYTVKGYAYAGGWVLGMLCFSLP
jgi:hypothetical protein